MINNQSRMVRTGDGSTVAQSFNKIGAAIGLSGSTLRTALINPVQLMPGLAAVRCRCCPRFHLWGFACKKVKSDCQQVAVSRVVQPEKPKPYRNKYDDDDQAKLARIQSDIETGVSNRLTMKIGREWYKMRDTRTRQAQIDLSRAGLLVKSGKRYAVCSGGINANRLALNLLISLNPLTDKCVACSSGNTLSAGIGHAHHTRCKAEHR